LDAEMKGRFEFFPNALYPKGCAHFFVYTILQNIDVSNQDKVLLNGTFACCLPLR